MTKTLLLILMLLLAFFMAFIPHIGYAYPLHVDEWTHLAYSKAIQQTGAITFLDPFVADDISGVGSDNVWVAFHLLWAIFQQVSGIDWLILYRFFPSIIFMLTVLSVYVLADRQGYGLEAAFFTCLLPTSIGILGPAFMVPMALGLLFIPLSLFLAFYIKSWPAHLLLLLVAGFLWLLHPPTAVILIIILLPYILINIKAHPLNSVSMLLAVLVPVIISLPWFFIRILSTAKMLLASQHIPPHVDIPALLLIYGILPVIFFFLGTIFLVKKGGGYNFGLMIGLVLLLVAGLVLVQLHFGLMILYFRGLSTMLLLISIIAGAGLFWIRTFVLPDWLLLKHKSDLFRKAGVILCAVSVVAIMASALPARFNVTYYHMIDDEDYRAFIWIRDHTTTDNTVYAVDPWKGSAFSALTGKNTLHRITEKQQPVDDIIFRFLNNGCADTGFIEENKITLIYNRLQCNNRKLARVRDYIFITDFNTVANLMTANMVRNAGFEAAYKTPPAFWARRSRNSQPLFIFPEEGRNGGTCAAIQMSSVEPFEPWPVARWVQNIPVHAHGVYMLNGWIKTSNIIGQGGVRVSVYWVDSAGKVLKIAGLMPYVKGTNDWTYYNGKVTAPPGAATGSINFEIAGCSGTAWFDDICIKEE